MGALDGRNDHLAIGVDEPPGGVAAHAGVEDPERRFLAPLLLEDPVVLSQDLLEEAGTPSLLRVKCLGPLEELRVVLIVEFIQGCEWPSFDLHR